MSQEIFIQDLAIELQQMIGTTDANHRAVNAATVACMIAERIAQTTPQRPRHATLPPEMEAEVRDAWQHDWTYDDDSYTRIVKRYPAWESAIAVLWVALDDEHFEQCAAYAPMTQETHTAQATIDKLTLLACQLRTALIDAKEAVEIVVATGGYENTLAEVNAALDAAEAALPLSENDPWLAQESAANMRRFGEVQP